jgi:hypothetical protein
MNWEQTNRFLFSFNDLICTAYSPNLACGKPVNSANQSVNTSDFRFFRVNYSPLFQVSNVCGEQVLFWIFEKFRAAPFEMMLMAPRKSMAGRAII